MAKSIFRSTIAISLLLWMILIFALSAQNAEQSSETSAGFTYKLFTLFYPDFSGMTAVAQQDILVQFSFFIRKAAHFTLYFVLGVLAFLNTVAFFSMRAFLKSVTALCFSVLYAASDEFHQLFVDGRAGQLRDVFIDSAGALFGIAICLFIYKVVENKMRKKTLLKQNGDLFDRLNTANARISELERDLNERDRELESLNEQVLNLRRELALKEQNEVAETAVEQELQVPAVPETEPAEEPDLDDVIDAVDSICTQINPPEKEDETVADAVEQAARDIPNLEECIEYGSQIIGKIVVSAAQYSNRLTVGGETRYKELLNLILGRTEVAKAEILDITASEAEAAVKKHMIDDVYEHAMEYFESVMAQI